METAYHYTTYRAWMTIQHVGLQPYFLNKPPYLGGEKRGIWLWPERLHGLAHLGSVLWQACMKGETRVVLLQCQYDPTTLVGYPEEWDIKHCGALEQLKFHDRVPCLVVTQPIPPENIELVADYDLIAMFGARETA